MVFRNHKKTDYPIVGMFGALFLACFLGACTPARMGLPGDFRGNAMELKAQGRQKLSFNEDFSFDGYLVRDVKRGWTTRTSVGIFFYKKMKAKQKYEFTLENQETGKNLYGYCATSVKAAELDFKTNFDIRVQWGLKSDTIFLTIIENDESEEHLIMVLEESGTRAKLLTGGISFRDREYRVEAVRTLENSDIMMSEATGYCIYENNRMIAAVDVLNEGSIFLHPDMAVETRDGLCAAATALMLYKNVME